MRSLSLPLLSSAVIAILTPSSIVTVTGFITTSGKSTTPSGCSQLSSTRTTTTTPRHDLDRPRSSSSTSSSSSSSLLASSSSSSSQQYEAGSFDNLEQINRDSDAIFSVIDNDGNGEISLDELTAHLTKSGYEETVVTKIFAKMDVNHDGSISGEEFRTGMVQFAPLRSAPGLGNYNADFVTEIQADADALFRNIDVDGDGTVTPQELTQYLKMVSSYTDPAIANLFAMLDVDQDGTISKEEVREAFIKYSALRQAVGEGPNFK